ncbi:hypothetical protein [Marinoscillum sp.]|uniref:hypothetical protein n=1 Tax=Marinoscillum sp. TaxID=2024838 RepID=UPI003BABECD5
MDKTNIRTGGSISWAEREEMIKEYLSGCYSKIELWKKYTGQTEEHGQLLNWMRKLGYIQGDPKLKQTKLVSSPRQQFTILDKPENDKDPVELQKKIKELKKQLEVAQLKVEGYELMIDIAEKELKIPIRKKSDTK